MAVGTVKWFNDLKGYGFIAQDDGSDYFVHHSHIVGDGFRTLHVGERVEFTEVQNERGKEATDVTRL
jgi:CspA family cold shock protein